MSGRKGKAVVCNVGIMALPSMPVGAADSCCHDLEEDGIGCWQGRDGDGLDGYGGWGEGFVDCCFHHLCWDRCNVEIFITTGNVNVNIFWL